MCFSFGEGRFVIGGVTSRSWFFSFFGLETVSSAVVFFLHCSEYLPGGKTQCFFLFGCPSHLGSVVGAGRAFFALACSHFSLQDGDP